MSTLTRGWKWPLTESPLLRCAVERGTLQMNNTSACGEQSQWLDHPGAVTAQGSKHRPGPPRGHSPRWVVCLLRGAGLRSCDAAGRNEPHRIPGRRGQPAHSLAGDAVSGAGIAAAPCCQPLAVVPLPLWRNCACAQSLQSRVGRALNGNPLTLLWHLRGRDPLFCKHTRGDSSVLEPSHGEKPFVSLCSSDVPVVWVYPVLSVLCHISPFRVASWRSTLVRSLRTNDAACTSTYNPHSLRVDASVWATPLLVIAVWHDFWGDFFWLCCLSWFQSSLLTTCGRVSYCVETSPSWLPPQDVSLSPNFLSPFHLIPLSCVIPKRLVCFSGYLGSSASVKKLFSGNCSTCWWSFDVFVGEKVGSLSYSSAILGLPPLVILNMLHISPSLCF